jgi:hypothetical protein
MANNRFHSRSREISAIAIAVGWIENRKPNVPKLKMSAIYL